MGLGIASEVSFLTNAKAGSREYLPCSVSLLEEGARGLLDIASGSFRPPNKEKYWDRNEGLGTMPPQSGDTLAD